MKMISSKDNFKICIEDEHGGSVCSQSVESNLLFKILEMLSEIKDGLNDVEDAINPR